MPSKDIPPLVAQEGELRQLMLALAQHHGVRNEVATLIVDRPDPPHAEVTLSALLRVARRAYGLSIADVIARGGPEKTVCGDFELGNRARFKNCKLSTLVRLAKGYSLPFPVIVSAALRQSGALPAPGAVKATTRIRQRTPVQ